MRGIRQHLQAIKGNNKELNNYIRELEKAGDIVKGKSDVEVLLKGFNKIGYAKKGIIKAFITTPQDTIYDLLISMNILYKDRDSKGYILIVGELGELLEVLGD